MTSASAKELRRQLAWLRRTNPEAYQDALATIFEKERRTQRAEYERSFLEFVKRAWQEVDPKPLSISWFLECICEHLQLILILMESLGHSSLTRRHVRESHF